MRITSEHTTVGWLGRAAGTHQLLALLPASVLAGCSPFTAKLGDFFFLPGFLPQFLT